MNEALVAPRTDRSKVIAWSFWDWGSAAFNAVVITFVFNRYLVQAVGDDLPGRVSASSWLAWSLGASGLFIAVLAPAMGQRADARGRRKRSLAILTAAVVVVTAAMFFVRDDYHYLWFGLVLVSIGSVLFELSQVPYFAMLRQVSSPDHVGRVSGIGWAFGYVGGIVLLAICLVGFILGDGDTRGLLNVTTEDGLNVRLVALLAAAWFAIFALPLFLVIPELPATATPDSASVGFFESYRVLWNDICRMWRDDRSTLQFLIASAFYRDGLSGVFTFGAILAGTVYGLADQDVIIFGIVSNISAAAGAAVGGWLDDKIGARAVIAGSLVAMLGVAVVLFFGHGPAIFWTFGLLLCIFVGPAQSASRSYLARITEPGKEGQNFGLYAMTGRAVSFMTPTLFGLFVFIGGEDRWGILGIMIVLAVGVTLLLRVPRDVGDKATLPR